MRNLERILEYAFTNTPYYKGGETHLGNYEEDPKQMIIPISTDIFEVPVFALYGLGKSYPAWEADYESIVVRLNYVGYQTTYKTLSAIIRSYLECSYRSSRLGKITLSEDPSKTYYATQGAIFDTDYNPVMLLTWEIKKEPTAGDGGDYDYKFLKPILRVRPDVVLSKSDSLQKYIVNKIIPTTLALANVRSPKVDGNYHFCLSNQDYMLRKLKVVIEDIPFRMQKIESPSISTTNKELLGIALDNLDELVQ